MSEESPNRTQEIEGPWRKLTPDRVNTENEVREYYLGKTADERLNENYGEGNWEFNTQRFGFNNELARIATKAENDLAREGMSNLRFQNIDSDRKGEARKPINDTYVSSDGVRLAGKIESRAAKPDFGDITISPDGDHHFQNTHDTEA